MKRMIRWMMSAVAVLVGLPLVCVVLLLITANTQMGRHWIERATSSLTGGDIRLSGLSGRFPDALRIDHIEVRDNAGPWLMLDKLALDWRPVRLFKGEADILGLEAGHIALERLPSASPDEKSSSVSPLPVDINLRNLHVERLDVNANVSGQAASITIAGYARIASWTQGEINLALRRLDREGSYSLQGFLEAASVRAQIALKEPAQGLISSLAGITALGALEADATLEGPFASLNTRIGLIFGPLQARLNGKLDFEHEQIAELSVTASAPKMQITPELSWQSLALDTQVHGAFTQPVADGFLRVNGLSAFNTAIRTIVMNLHGNTGQVQLSAELNGIKLPGPQPDLLHAAPLTIQATTRLDKPERPVKFTIKHPLINAEGEAITAGDLRAELTLNLPDLKPLAGAGGLDVHGNTALTVRAFRQADTDRLDVEGKIGLTGGSGPLPKLLGNAARLVFSVTRRGPDITLPRLQLDGKTLTLAANGKLINDKTTGNWKFLLSDLADISPTVSGQLAGQGQIEGPLDKLAATADLKGELATRELPRGPINAKLRLDGLPRAPVGQLNASAELGGSPLEFDLAANSTAEGAIQIAIERAGWKSGLAKGNLTLPKDAEVPIGKIDLRMARLEDLRPLFGQNISGTLTATLESAMQGGRPLTRVQLETHDVALPGTASVEHASLDLTITDPTRRPVIDGKLTLDGLSVGTLHGLARLEMGGPMDAISLRLSSSLTIRPDIEARLSGIASLNIPAGRAAVSDLQATWKKATLRLLTPANISFADGVAVDRLRLGLREAVLDVSGRISPSLDLNADLRDVSASLATLFVPELSAKGTLNANAKLTGTAARPGGVITAEVADLQMRSGPGRGLPTASLKATAQLAGQAANIDVRLAAGRDATLNINGETPLISPGPLDLKAVGSLDLRLLDALLSGEGRRLRGQVSINGGLGGTLAEPLATGKLELSGGEVQDLTVGAQIRDIKAMLQAEGRTIRIAKLEGHAGPGTVSASGVLDLAAEGLPVDLEITARNARPLDSERLSVNLNGAVAIRGKAREQLSSTGHIRINRAEIRIPERMPATISVLNVRRPGAEPPPPPSPGPDIALDLMIEAANQIFVRGRGLDAELGGKIQVRGTTANPQPNGHFELRRGDFTLAGKRLVFSKGVVGFDSGSLTNPSLNFISSTASANITATLTVGGSANKPTITLSSVPELPQDEVLAHLLFGRGASSLGPMELVQIAASVASLTGVTSGVGQPLETVRKTLGLDRLSVGGATPALEAGRYVAPGVYLGAKQGITGGGTQATVQIDITNRLKLEGTVGTGGQTTGSTTAPASTNSVGVIYQYEY